MTDAERRSLVRDLWLMRPPKRRKEDDVAIFYGALERTCPELLKRVRGDPYLQLKEDLRDLIER